jgi:hypothetical protein
MSPLAARVYKQLVTSIRRNKISMTYGELAAAVEVHHRNPQLHAALGEVTNACRHLQLPCLPAIVWRADNRRPSDGYYKVAHPRAHTDEARVAAWEREHARVIASIDQFPTKLPSSGSSSELRR